MAEESPGNLWIDDQDQGLFHLSGGSVIGGIPWAKLGRKDFASALVADRAQGGLWLGIYQGGVAYVKDAQVRASYGTADGLGRGIVNDLRLDRGVLWASTEGGLSRLKDSRVATLTSKNGLPCDTVYWVIEDDTHFFWLYTECGLVRIARPELNAWAADPAHTIKTAVFDSTDGVRSISHISGYSPAVAKTPDGKLWFTFLDGVSVVDPSHLPFNKLPPPVHVEEVKVDGKDWDASHGWRLPALTRDVEIHYTALSLVEPVKNRFRIKLEGHDRDWQDAENERKKSYNDLPPRNYRFRVMASNNSGVWNETGDSLEFSIAPAYYQTTWFQASCVAAFLGLVWALYRYRVHQVAREFNVRLEERVGERVRIARELHDTLLQTVQGLMLRLQVVDEMLPPGKAKEELEETLEVGDRAIIEGRNTVRDLRIHLNTKLPSALRALGDELASTSEATFRVIVEGPILDLHSILGDEIYCIAREALRNAFAHARAKHIEVEITYKDRLLRLRIRDDGDGIPEEILNQGREGHFGLPGMRERAGKMGATLNIWSGAGAGTEIDLSIDGLIAYGQPQEASRFRVFPKEVGLE